MPDYFFGKEASEFTCSFLKQGTITLETDGKDLFDHYDRLLAWVWVDDKLHQEEITMAGFVRSGWPLDSSWPLRSSWPSNPLYTASPVHLADLQDQPLHLLHH